MRNGWVNGAGSELSAILLAKATEPLTERSRGRATAAPASTENFMMSRLDSVMARLLLMGCGKGRNASLGFSLGGDSGCTLKVFSRWRQRRWAAFGPSGGLAPSYEVGNVMSQIGNLELSRSRRSQTRRTSVLVAVLAVVVSFLSPLMPTARAAVAPVGQGFTVTAGDLSFILKQIRIAERHAATLTASNPCGTLVGPAKYQIPDRLTAYGLRTVDGSCNDLIADKTRFGAADEQFPRLTSPRFRDADQANTFPVPLMPGSVRPDGSTSYSTLGDVVDSQPRTVSNLIVDQTSTNPAAIAAAKFPVRSQNSLGEVEPCTTDPTDPTDPATGI